MYNKITGIPALALATVIVATSAMAQSPTVSAEEKALCIEAITDLTDGKPPTEAVKLCNQGKLEEAMDKAMTAQGG